MKSIAFVVLTLTAAIVTLLACASTAWAQSQEVLLKCRAIKEPSARLACYDTIDVMAVEAKRAEPNAIQHSGAAATVVTKPSDKASESSIAQAEFGLHVPTAADKLKKIESRIIGAFNGWGPNSWITLENGQVWQVKDDTRRPLELDSPKVIVERGLLGAFYMVIAGTNHTPRVKRVR